jgi:transglutaminase-like putative cysteine protease
MIPLLQFLNRFRPREGWMSAILLLVATLCPAAALFQAARDPQEMGILLLLPPTAAITALRLARSRLSAKWAAIIGVLLGSALVFLFIGQLLPPLNLFWSELGYAADWLGQRQQERSGQPLPFARIAGFIWQQVNILSNRFWWWGQSVASGVKVQENIVFLMLAALLAWLLAFFASWQVFRNKFALKGLLPSGAAIATITFFGGGITAFYLITFLFCTLWLVALCHLWTRRSHWDQTGTDYPGELGMELVLALSPGLTLILLLASFFPVIHPNQIRETFWQVMDGPWSHAEKIAERFFGPLESGYGSNSSGASGELPTSHLLGGGPELSETIVLYVSTNDPPPPLPDAKESESEVAEPAALQRYWRKTTYDIYTGLGWGTSPLENHPLSTDHSLTLDLPSGFDLIQQYQLVRPSEILYAVNAPIQVDQPVQAWWRAPEDLVYLTGETDLYNVISRPPAPTVTELRALSSITTPLSSDIAEFYLALPDTLPQRVKSLAHEIAGKAQTRYDQARAIELYLRTYPYNLDLPNPPSDRDLVDYFLFDLQEGYCDYYASAMVVMARAVGVPARLATGYAQGTYNQDTKQWVVTEKDSHSWVEIYFQDIGWVEFEPTAGLPGLERPGGSELPQVIIPPLPPHPMRWWQQIPWILVGMVAAVVLLIFFIAWLWHPSRQPASATELVRDRYARLLRWGERLKHPLQDGQTPYEYSLFLNEALQTRGQGSAIYRIKQASVKAPPEITLLSDTFVLAQYNPKPLTNHKGQQIRVLWPHLRRRLWWLWLGKRFGKNSKHKAEG